MIPEILIKIIVAAILAIITGRLIIKNKEQRKSIETIFTNAALVFIISVKVSLLLTHFSSARAEPMFLLYGWGSWLNTLLGFLAVMIYFAWFVIKKSEHKPLHAKYLLISTSIFLFTFYGSSLFFNQTKETVSINSSAILEMHDIEGNNIEIEPKSPIILNFWATWCPPCRAEMPELNGFALQNPKANFFAINNITSEKEGLKGLNNFLTSKNYQMTVVPDYNNVLTEKFDINSFPTTVLLNHKGEILEKHVGVVSKETLEKWLLREEN